MNQMAALEEVRNRMPSGVLVIGHSEDGGGWLVIKSGEQVLAQVVLPRSQKDQLGYELILGNKFGSGVLPVTLL